jgi:KDO2-lipid IV(A) lauroyltransferase
MKFAFFILYLIQLLPFAAIHKLADFIGTLAYYAVAPRRRVGEVNLRLCYPEWNEAERKKVLKRHFQHMAKLLCEYGLYWYADAARLKKLVRYQDKHYLDEALAAGEKVILLYPHFTAFEMAVYTLNQDVPLVSMYSHQKNKAMDEQILKGRHRYNNVFLIGRTEGLRAIIKHLRKSDAPFLYLPDQDFGRADSIFVDFFGIPTATIAGLSRIAAMTGAKVIPAHSHPRSRQHGEPALLSGLGTFPRQRCRRRHTAHERLYRSACARAADAIFLAAQALQNAARRRGRVLLKDAAIFQTALNLHSRPSEKFAAGIWYGFGYNRNKF